MAYFGYPRAHEDDAERVVRAGLGSIEAVGGLDAKSVKRQARVGIATGLVVVGDMIGEGPALEQSVVGETPNLAARLQACALDVLDRRRTLELRVRFRTSPVVESPSASPQ